MFSQLLFLPIHDTVFPRSAFLKASWKPKLDHMSTTMAMALSLWIFVPLREKMGSSTYVCIRNEDSALRSLFVAACTFLAPRARNVKQRLSCTHC